MTDDEIIAAAKEIQAKRDRIGNVCRTDYTREELIAICEKGVVHQDKWRNRDTCSSQRKLGECWALLRAGCAFYIRTGDGQGRTTNRKTIWVEVNAHGFAYFDHSGDLDDETFYLPTPEQLEKANGGDWY